MYVFVHRVDSGKVDVILNENVLPAVLLFNSKLGLRCGEKRYVVLPDCHNRIVAVVWT